MTEAVTVGIVFIIVVVVAGKLWLANRRAKRLAREAERRAAERREKERALMEKVRKIRDKDDVDRAAAAIERDPKRAAKVVSRMMKDKNSDG